ncbi:hypothetical protein QWY87_08730 [Lutimonas halocynthiae]|uniref:hypothetical protein n=1 Tax=Lutimonas halocynthiae TaxID=1446477 RepID=UPI0025B61017|nr:hypothetical protein [Lutimonas halocynthiae]MDN3642780.1 hypothetical protein [Lutimonas halocynthiae]
MVTNSCDFISPKKTTLINTELANSTIDFNDVDVYPLFMDCNNCDTSEKQNLCFEMELIRRLQKLTSKTVLDATGKVNDTVLVDILVNTQGEISIVKIHKNEIVAEQIPELDSLLYKSIASLPAAVQPSLKRGIPVNSMFKLPILVSVKE